MIRNFCFKNYYTFAQTKKLLGKVKLNSNAFKVRSPYQLWFTATGAFYNLRQVLFFYLKFHLNSLSRSCALFYLDSVTLAKVFVNEALR